jgi:hypothetical protein
MISFRHDQNLSVHNSNSVEVVTREFRSEILILLSLESRSIGDRLINAVPRSRDAAMTLAATNNWSMNGVVNPLGMPKAMRLQVGDKVLSLCAAN